MVRSHDRKGAYESAILFEIAPTEASGDGPAVAGMMHYQTMRACTHHSIGMRKQWVAW